MRPIWFIFPGALALLLGVLGCDDDCLTRTCGDLPAAAVIEGKIDAGGLPCEFEIEAHRIGAGGMVGFKLYDYPDSSGLYHLELPHGDYRLCVNCGTWTTYGAFHARASHYVSNSGPVLSPAEADTFTMNAEQDSLHIDLILGSLEVTLHVPNQIEETSIALFPELILDEGQRVLCPHWTSMTADVVDGKAVFSLPGFHPGECRLKLEVGYYGQTEEFWLPHGHQPDEAQVLTVIPGETTSYELTLEQDPATLSGTITGSWQLMGMSVPQITLFDLDSCLVARTEAAQPSGEYSFVLYDPTPAKALIDIGGSQGWLGGESFADARRLDLGPGIAIAGADLVESGICFELFSPSYQRACDFALRLCDAADHREIRVITISSSLCNPYIHCPNLMPGSYIAFIENTYLRMDWHSQWIDRVATPEEAMVLTIPSAGEALAVPVNLELGGRIAGSIYAQEETLCPLAAIYIADAWTGECIGRTGCLFTGSSCLCRNPEPYSAAGIPDGRYKVGAVIGGRDWNPPEGTYWYPGTPDFETAETVTVRAGELLSGIDIHIPE